MKAGNSYTRENNNNNNNNSDDDGNNTGNPGREWLQKSQKSEVSQVELSGSV